MPENATVQTNSPPGVPAVTTATPLPGAVTTTASPETTTVPETSALKRLMQINAQMFEGTIRVIGQQNMALHQQISELTAANAALLLETVTTTAPPETAAAPETSALQLMRINAEMFEGTIRVLGQQNMALHQKVSELTAAHAALLLDLDTPAP